jgi:hypothetical protein
MEIRHGGVVKQLPHQENFKESIAPVGSPSTEPKLNIPLVAISLVVLYILFNKGI